jgi:hypothetical protein
MYTEKDYIFATSANLKHSCKNLFKGNHIFNISVILISILYCFTFGYDGVVLSLNIFSCTDLFYL